LFVEKSNLLEFISYIFHYFPITKEFGKTFEKDFLKEIKNFEIKDEFFGKDVYEDKILDIILTSVGPGPQVIKVE
jgi:hypothetical protein